MKKGLILGLLALSTVAMSTGTNTTSVDVVTDLTLNGTGIIITPEEGGNQNGFIHLPHGTKDVPTASKTATIPAYIKSTTGALPAGIVVRIDLDADKSNKNNLSVGGTATSPAEKIAHTLTGTIENGTTTKSALTISGDIVNDNTEVTTTKDILKVNFVSDITQEAMTGKMVGTYKNTSNLSVTVLAK